MKMQLMSSDKRNTTKYTRGGKKKNKWTNLSGLEGKILEACIQCSMLHSNDVEKPW